EIRDRLAIVDSSGRCKRAAAVVRVNQIDVAPARQVGRLVAPDLSCTCADIGDSALRVDRADDVERLRPEPFIASERLLEFPLVLAGEPLGIDALGDIEEIDGQAAAVRVDPDLEPAFEFAIPDLEAVGAAAFACRPITLPDLAACRLWK